MPLRHSLRACLAPALLAAAPLYAHASEAGPQPSEASGCANQIIVQNANDSGDGSLRSAMLGVCDGGTVRFAQRFVIQLGSEISVDRPITIDGSSVSGGDAGPNGPLLQIRGGSDHRIFRVQTNGDLTLRRLRLSNGTVTDVGGAVHNTGRLSVIECRMDNNSVASGNLGGGAIFSDSSSILRIEGSTFDGNSAIRGSAVFNRGDADLVNSTFSGNKGTTNEGAIQNRGVLVANHITVTDNGRTDSTPTAGGLFAFSADTTIINSILAGNRGRDCFISGGTVDTVAVLAQSTRNCPVQLTSNPELEALGDNGGVTQTHALAANSPALSAGAAPFCLPRDQRGFRRPLSNRCDLGAVERDGLDVIFENGFESPAPNPSAH